MRISANASSRPLWPNPYLLTGLLIAARGSEQAPLSDPPLRDERLPIFEATEDTDDTASTNSRPCLANRAGIHDYDAVGLSL